MRKPAKANDKGRETLRFDEGELWCSDEANPPMNPPGWYFRPRRGPDQPWIGPYSSRAAAEEAPCSGDPLRVAERRLKQWLQEKDQEEVETEAEPVAAQPEPVVPAPDPETKAVPVQAPVLEPEPAPEPIELIAPQPATQLALDLGAPPESPTTGRPRRPSGRRSGAALAPDQVDLPF